MSPDSSYVPDYVSDRGPTEYFHGRVRILGNFDKLLKDSMDTQTGSTFLIQGAPGAGKTALLDVLSADARAQSWNVASIKIKDLYDPISMAQSLGESYVTDKQYAANVGIHGLGGGYSRNVAGYSSVDGLLKEEAPKEGLILVLDEAHRMNKIPVDSERHIITGDTLDVIHNGELSRPVILLAAGLGPTEEAFSSLGISRFKGGCFVELGGLEKESERAVIKDWLIKEGGAKGDPTPWIDQIAQKTHGWPQHISAYGDAAAKQIQSDRGEMTAAGLDVVLRVGAERREAYYRHRAKGIDRKERCSLARLIQTVSINDGLDQREIVEFLSREYGEVEAKDLFKRAVARGVLHSQDEVYSIPIPSMQTWLISNYARERIETPPIPRSILPPSRDRDLGWER